MVNDRNGQAEMEPAADHDFGPVDSPWAVDADLTDPDPSPTGLGPGLVSLGFIKGALRRSALFWFTTAAVGLVIGAGWYAAKPPAPQATATVLVPPATYTGEILDDQAIAQSRTVAAAALKDAGSQESVTSFLRQYSVATPTDRVLVITTKAASASAAVRAANAVAGAFLAFQQQLLEMQDRLANASFEQQVTQAQQRVDSLSAQILSLSHEGSAPGQSARLATLRSQYSQAADALTDLQAAQAETLVTNAVNTATAVQGSRVLDAGAVTPQSPLKSSLIYAMAGLIAGLALGTGIVVIRAVTSDKLRRRDDVARVLGAPVRLSVGAVTGRPWGDAGAFAHADPEIQRVAAYLVRSLPEPASGAGLASLAIVAVDDSQAAALALVSVATACGERGLRVVVADLCRGAPAAGLLGADGPGLHQTTAAAGKMSVVIPEPGDVAPVGPLNQELLGGWPDRVPERLIAASGSADLLLTLASLDPAVGAEHLATWTRSAVVMLTAGRSVAERVHSVGEMIRLAGIEHVSAVLLGADATDQSLGVEPAHEAPGMPSRRAAPMVGDAESAPIAAETPASLSQPRLTT
jgi:capsular polysaccharide biosynthesis protein